MGFLAILLFALSNIYLYRPQISNNQILILFYTFAVLTLTLCITRVWLFEANQDDYVLSYFIRCFAICATWCQALAFVRLAFAFTNQLNPVALQKATKTTMCLLWTGVILLNLFTVVSYIVWRNTASSFRVVDICGICVSFFVIASLVTAVLVTRCGVKQMN
jgi:hypothetical protein